MKLRFSRRIFNLCVICLMFGGVLFAWQTVVKLQSQDGEKTQKSNDETTVKTNDKVVSVLSKGRGNPFINFKDGTDLNAASQENAQPKVLASADFDSDGIADLVTADASGTVKFYRGNLLRKGDGEKGRKGDEEAFALTDKLFSLNISPDFLFTGDFNADGQQDILATAKNANESFLMSIVFFVRTIFVSFNN
jgi:FG-GAP-like repeat